MFSVFVPDGHNLIPSSPLRVEGLRAGTGTGLWPEHRPSCQCRAEHSVLQVTPLSCGDVLWSFLIQGCPRPQGCTRLVRSHFVTGLFRIPGASVGNPGPPPSALGGPGESSLLQPEWRRFLPRHPSPSILQRLAIRREISRENSDKVRGGTSVSPASLVLPLFPARPSRCAGPGQGRPDPDIPG